MITFGVCRKCGLKLGRKSDFCPRCVEHSGVAAGEPSAVRRAATARRGFHVPLLLTVVAALIMIIFMRTRQIGIAPW